MENKRLKNRERYIQLLRSTDREGIDELVMYIISTDFFHAPASTRFHLAYDGGLLEHSLNVYDRLKHLIESNENEYYGCDEDSIIITALLHDLCKADFYTKKIKNVKDATGEWVQEEYYTIDDQKPLGHGEKSIMLAMEHIKLTEDEMYAIRWHMGEFTENQGVSQAYNKSKLAVAVHIADLEATYIIESRG